MPDLASPISNCMAPPCYSLGGILQGVAFVAAAVVALPGASVDALSGDVAGGVVRLVSSAVAAILVWLALGAIASTVAALLFHRRTDLFSLVAGLGFALTP